MPTSGMTVSGILKNANFHISRIFLYKFGHRTEHSPWPAWSGVMHGDEIAYVFGDPLRSRPALEYTEAERTLSGNMMAFWANFAKTG